jgi:hypothetical protein
MSTVGEPQDAVPADGGTMQLRAQPEDAAPVPQDAVPVEPGTVRLGRAAVPPRTADPDVVPTVRLPADPGVVPTVRLNADPEAIPTVRMAGGSEAVPTPTLMVPVEPQAAPAAPATTLHMSVGPTLAEATVPQAVPAPQAAPAPEAASAQEASVSAPASAADPGLIRFGPGVPDPKTARTIAMWKGEVAAEPQTEQKRRRGWLFWVPVLLVFLALLGWWLDGLLAPPALKITGASVQVASATVGCNGKATITATVTTDGQAGTFRYRWIRNDGTDSGLLTETVAVGTRQVQLPLIWTLSGPGTFDGKATLEIENHPALTGTATFAYSCAG